MGERLPGLRGVALPFAVTRSVPLRAPAEIEICSSSLAISRPPGKAHGKPSGKPRGKPCRESAFPYAFPSYLDERERIATTFAVFPSTIVVSLCDHRSSAARFSVS